jgi:hypothetical protein
MSSATVSLYMVDEDQGRNQFINLSNTTETNGYVHNDKFIYFNADNMKSERRTKNIQVLEISMFSCS